MKTKLLVVDDDLSVLESIRKLLESEGYDVLTARDGVEALEYFQSAAVDLVILDVNLGSESGWDVFKVMAKMNPFVPTIIITAESGHKAQATAAGVEALIEKPIDVPVFLGMIEDLLAETSGRRLKRLCGDDEYCRYVARHYETFLKMMSERRRAPMKLSPEFTATLPFRDAPSEPELKTKPRVVGSLPSGI